MTYEEIEVLFEDKTLKEWNDMTDEELRTTESYQEALQHYEGKKRADIERWKQELEDNPDWPEYSGPGESDWNTKSRIKKSIHFAESSEPEEEALAELKETLTQVNTAMPKGITHRATGTIVERGYALMDSRGWLYADVQYYGGGDSGGVESIDIVQAGPTGLVDVPLTNWADWEENEDLKVIIDEERLEELGGLLLKSPEIQQGRYWKQLIQPQFHTDNPLVDPINEKWGGWAFNGTVSGTMTWDNRKTKPNKVRETRDGKYDFYPIDDSKSMDEMIPNPDYRKEPVLDFEQSEFVSYRTTLDDLHDEIRLE